MGPFSVLEAGFYRDCEEGRRSASSCKFRVKLRVASPDTGHDVSPVL